MLGDGLSPPTCVIGSPKVGRESYPYHLAGSPLIVGMAIQNTDSSDSTVAAILNHRPEIHAKQHMKWRAFEERCLKPRATKMACGKPLDPTKFGPVEDCSRLNPSIADISAFQANNFDMTFIYECVRFHGISTVGDSQTAALDGARDEPGAQAVCREARHIKPEAPRTRLHDDSHGLSCRAAAAEIRRPRWPPCRAQCRLWPPSSRPARRRWNAGCPKGWP